MSIICAEHLWHRYGSSWAIRDIDLTIDHCGVVGLLGSNGAGKSTTMNILCGVLNQTKGKVSIGGIDLNVHPLEAKKQIGFLPQNAPLHPDLTVQEYLTYCAHLRLIPKKKILSAVQKAKQRCGVDELSGRLIKNLSGGYRQRVGIAQAIIHNPQLVVLDEPTNGLDPNQISEVRSLIKEIAAERAVIFSSHILSEVQATCNRVIMIENGEVVFSNSMDAFNNYIEPTGLLLTLEADPDPEELRLIPRLTKVERLYKKCFRVHFQGTKDIAESIVKTSLDKGWHLQEIMFEKTSLEEIFAQLSKKETK